MSKKKLHFAIVGSGAIAQVHIQCIQELADAELTAICGRDKQKIQDRIGGNKDIKIYTDYHEMLADDEIDVVTILTPNATHADFGKAAAEAGKHVIIEKPMDINMEKTNSLIQQCKKSGVKLCCISQHRFDDAVCELKKAVDDGELGQLNFGASHTKWYRSQEYYDEAAWRGSWSLGGGGALMNQSIHYIDLLQYLMGPVDEVFGYCTTRSHERIKVEDIAVASLKFKSGAVGMIEGNTTAYPGFCSRLDIYGEGGSVIIENDEIKEWELLSGKGFKKKVKSVQKVGKASPEISHQSHLLQIRDMIHAIREDREPLVNGDEAKKTLQIIWGIYESAKTGKAVKV